MAIFIKNKKDYVLLLIAELIINKKKIKPVKTLFKDIEIYLEYKSTIY